MMRQSMRQEVYLFSKNVGCIIERVKPFVRLQLVR